MQSKKIILVVLIAFVVSLFTPATAQAEPTVAFGEPDQYGYVGKLIPAGGDYAWIDVASDPAASLVFDLVTDPNEYDLKPYTFPSGFRFPFYEVLYDRAYVNPNGFLTFVDQYIQNAYINQQIPSEAEPNTYVAGFWDDLVLQKGLTSVYAVSHTAGPKPYVAFEWKDALFFGRGTEERVTFEIVLYQNGNIVMAYQSVSTSLPSMTIGIEDTNGTDGITFVYNDTPPDAGTVLLYERPTDGIHLKALPVYQSKFNRPNETNLFHVQVFNNSDPTQALEPLKIHIVVESDWQVDIFNQGVKLQNTDDDAALELGDLAIGTPKTLDVRVNAPDGAIAGSSASTLLRVMIEQDAVGRQAVVRLRNALPVPYAQLYFDKTNNLGAALQLNYSDYQTTQALPMDMATANSVKNSLTMTDAVANNFVIAWSRGDADFATINYLVANPLKSMAVDMIKAVPNSGSTRDLEPALASSLDGRAGFAFVRKTPQSGGELNNVYLALLDVASGGWLTPEPINITNNGTPYIDDTTPAPRYQTPRITATANNRFLVTWDQFTNCGDGCYNHAVQYRMYDSSGNPASEIKTLYTTQIKTFLYTGPAVTSLSDGRIFVAYTKETNDQPRQVGYQILLGNGNAGVAEVLIADADAEVLDAVELKGGNANSRIMLAWVDRSKNYAASYALIEATGALVETKALPAADGIYASNVSVTRDNNGHAIFTWSDGYQERNFYYALVTANGEVQTPAMSYMTGDNMLTSGNGGGNAFFNGTGPMYLPLIKR